MPVTYGFDTQSGCTNCDIGSVSYEGITETLTYDQHGVLMAHQDVSGNQRTVAYRGYNGYDLRRFIGDNSDT